MALRIVLVALVACLGLDSSSVEGLAAWGRSGQEWVSARLADVSRLRLEAEPVEVVATVPAAEPTPGRVDLAFEAVVEGMASGFSADLASKRPGSPVEEAVALVEPEEEPASAAAPTAESSRLEKISTAVRLTRQAVDAWTSVIRPAVERAVEVEEERADSF